MHSEGGQRSPVAPARLFVHLEVPTANPLTSVKLRTVIGQKHLQHRGRDGSVGSPCLVSGVRDGRRAQVQRAADNLVKIVSKC